MLKMTEDDESKIIAAAAPALIGLYTKKREGLVRSLLGKYRSGETNFIPVIAELSIVDSFLSEANARLTDYNKGR